MSTNKPHTKLALLLAACASLSGQASAATTGLWNFDSGDLSATIGLDLGYRGQETIDGTQFGTTAALGIPNINGQVANVMKFPKTTSIFEGYTIYTIADPNGGGNLLNQYTVLMDVYFPTASSGKTRALLQTESFDNAEFFINSADGIGTDGGPFDGTVTGGAWHRLALAVDTAATPPVVAKFIDGVKVAERTLNAGVDSRWALTQFDLLLFSDDNGETELGYINSLQIRDEKMSDIQIAAFGGATADGIPSGAPANPYFISLLPSPETARVPSRSTVSPRPLIEAILEDGVTLLNPASVRVQIDNGPLEMATVTKTGTTTTVRYTAATGFLSAGVHRATVTFEDDAVPPNALGTSWQFAVGPYASFTGGGTPGAVNTRGFVVRTALLPNTLGILNPNTVNRAIKQINGTLLDTNGAVVGNAAFPGLNPDGSHDLDLINFHRDGSAYGAFASDVPFPGIPGVDGGNDYFTTEVLSYLDLPAGIFRLGVSVSTDRTDAATDDGYVLFSGRDIQAPVLGSFFRGNVPAFSASFTTNEFNVVATQAGVYCVRLLFYQTLNDASLEFYTVDEATGDKILINDSTDARALPAYRHTTAPTANKPFTAEINPPAGVSGVSPTLPIEILLQDDLTQVNVASIRLSLNGTLVTPIITQSGGRTRVFYQPNATRANPTNNMLLTYSDNSLPTPMSFTNAWSFTIAVTTDLADNVSGLWNFDFCDLSATIGSPLQYLDGPAGSTAQKTTFGTCTSLGVPLINGEDAKIMGVPGDLSRNIGYIMTHGIAPNGGGTRVNQYTLIMDVFVATTGPGAASLLQVNSLNNTDDGDLFWQGNNFGQGTDGYRGAGTFTAGAWHRVCAAYDEAAVPPVVTKYVDGIKQDDWTAGQGLDHERRALLPTAILFGDGDQDERRAMYVNSIQIRSGKLSDGEMAALGGPSADGIPLNIPATRVTGQWNFDNNINFPSMGGFLAPTVGRPLQYLDGAAGTTFAQTMFGTCSALGIPLINGVDAKVMRVPGNLDRNIGYVMTHGIAPNGGGAKVNQYTLVMDILVEAAGPGAASLLQVNSLNNTDDGDLFWQGNNFGQGTDGYRGAGTFTAGAWHRICIAYDEAASPPVATKYVDGIKQDDWTAGQGLDHERRALLPTAILFGDGDQDERRVMYVDSIQIRAGKLSDAEMAALGSPSGGGIPVVVPKSGVSGQWNFDVSNPFLNGYLAPTVGKALQYLDGPAGATFTKTMFGTCSALGVPLINGSDELVMQVPGDLDRNIGYIMEHLIAPNGGGSRVNQYTLIMDLLINTTGPGAASLLQVNSLNNTDDGDLFWQGNNFGQGSGDGYAGTGILTPGTWHRVCAAYDEAANPPVVTKYVDGIFQDDWNSNQGLDAPRRALQPTAILFGDGDQDERRMMWVNSIQIRAGAMSKAEMAALGAPAAGGIPINVTLPASISALLSFQVSGGNLLLSWPAALTGYVLEYTPDLTTPVWTVISPTPGNCATVPINTSMRYYRLRQE